jgi:hypothetical protein
VLAGSHTAAADESAFEGEPLPPGRTEEGYRKLFNGKDLTGWVAKPGAWAVEDGLLTPKGHGHVWTVRQYGDFALTLEFKIAKGSNSGVGLRVDPSIQPWWRDGALEIQILDTAGKKKLGKNDCGAMYDLVAPKQNAMKPAGQWNRLGAVAKGSQVTVELNGVEVVDIDLNQWSETGKNPDGTKNKYKRAMKDMPRRGHILLQDHGDPIWFRNIGIVPMDDAPPPE